MLSFKHNTGHTALKVSNSQDLKKRRKLLLILVPLLLLFLDVTATALKIAAVQLQPTFQGPSPPAVLARPLKPTAN